MGKLGSFAAGVGGGYLASKRYADSEKRKTRELDILNQMSKGKYADEKDKLSLLSRAYAEGNSGEENLTEEDLKKGYANGGMIGGIQACADMPSHWDKMDWQRQSFKK